MEIESQRIEYGSHDRLVLKKIYGFIFNGVCSYYSGIENSITDKFSFISNSTFRTLYKKIKNYEANQEELLLGSEALRFGLSEGITSLEEIVLDLFYDSSTGKIIIKDAEESLNFSIFTDGGINSFPYKILSSARIVYIEEIEEPINEFRLGEGSSCLNPASDPFKLFIPRIEDSLISNDSTSDIYPVNIEYSKERISSESNLEISEFPEIKEIKNLLTNDYKNCGRPTTVFNDQRLESNKAGELSAISLSVSLNRNKILKLVEEIPQKTGFSFNEASIYHIAIAINPIEVITNNFYNKCKVVYPIRNNSTFSKIIFEQPKNKNKKLGASYRVLIYSKDELIIEMFSSGEYEVYNEDYDIKESPGLFFEVIEDEEVDVNDLKYIRYFNNSSIEDSFSIDSKYAGFKIKDSLSYKLSKNDSIKVIVQSNSGERFKEE